VSLAFSVLQGLPGGEISVHLGDSLESGGSLVLGLLEGGLQFLGVSLVNLDSLLHGDNHLSGVCLSASGSLEVHGKSLSGSDHDLVVGVSLGDHLLEVSLVLSEELESFSHDNSDSTEVLGGPDGFSHHLVLSSLGSDPLESPHLEVILESLKGDLHLEVSGVNLDLPFLLEVHLLFGVGLLGLVGSVFPRLDGSLVGLLSHFVDEEGLLKGLSGKLGVNLSSLHFVFHVVSSSACLLHGGDHLIGSLLGLLEETELVLVFGGPPGDNAAPVDNGLLGDSERSLSNLLGFLGDDMEFVVSVHVSLGLLHDDFGGISLLSGSVSLGFPVSGELLHSDLLDLLNLDGQLGSSPDTLGVVLSLDSGDSGNLRSDEVHLGFVGEDDLSADDSAGFLLTLDSLVEHLSGVPDGNLPLFVLFSGSFLSGESVLVGLFGVFDLDVSLPDGLLGSSKGDVSSGVGDLGFLDLTELSGEFHLGFTGGDSGEVGVSIGSLLGSDGKSDGGSGLGVSDTSVFDGELELETGDVGKSLLFLHLLDGSQLEGDGGLELSISDGLEGGHVLHSGLSSVSLLSGVSEGSDDLSSSGELSLVGSEVIGLVLSGSGVDVLELTSLGADESGLVEAVSVHPVRSANNGNTSGVSTSGAVGLSFTPVLELERLSVDPSVALGGLASTDPVGLDVGADHLSDLVLLLGGEDRYELTTPFTADASGVVPGLLLLEDLKLSDHLVGNSLEVSGLGSSSSDNLGFLLGLDLSNSSSNLGLGGGTSSSSFLLSLGLGLSFGGSLGDLVVLDRESGGLGSSSFLSGLLNGSSGFGSSFLLLLSDLKSLKLLSEVRSLLGSGSSGLGLISSDLLVSGELISGSLGFDLSIDLSFSSSSGSLSFDNSSLLSFSVSSLLIGFHLSVSSLLLGKSVSLLGLNSSGFGSLVGGVINFNNGNSLGRSIGSISFLVIGFHNSSRHPGHFREVHRVTSICHTEILGRGLSELLVIFLSVGARLQGS